MAIRGRAAAKCNHHRMTHSTLTVGPTLTVGLANYGALYEPEEWYRFVDLARAADDAGVDRIVVVDHVVMGPHTENYAWGTFPVPPEAPWYEPLIVLAAVASATTRVRLATGILIAPLRPAVLLAKQAATLDVLSRGRLDLGVGTGWQREEYDASGIDFDRRGELLSDILAACKVLWRDTPAELDTPTLSFRDVYCEPKPLQPGGVPLWIGGSLHGRNLRRIVEWGDAWIPIMGATLDDISAGVRRIGEAWTTAGRDPAVLQVQAPLRIERTDDGRPDLARSLATVPDLVAAGATDVHVALRAFNRDPADAPQVFAEMVRRFADAAT
jgi:probable F420-dependent oxidoreductase